MTKLIGIFGGTFDPVHNGHTETIRSLLEIISFHQIKVIPNGKPPHRPSVFGSSFERLKMTSIAFKSFDKVVIDDREINRKGPSYAIDTAKEISTEISKDSSLIWIMGLDAFSSIDSWHRWEEFLGIVNIIVMFRPNIEIPKGSIASKLLQERSVNSKEDISQKDKGRILLCKVIPIDISSTTVRENLFQGKEVSDMIFYKVNDYIESKKLYVSENEKLQN
tara:strand:- start:64 stop:726 length:663 start_codon:yes stop_codon:yes gene_type:complete